VTTASGECSLWSLIVNGSDLSSRFLHCGGQSFALGELDDGSSLDCDTRELSDAAVLIATADQLAAALTAIELDGVVRRLVLSPPDVTAGYLDHLLETAAIDTVVSDGIVDRFALPDRVRLVTCRPDFIRSAPPRSRQCDSEWVLLTSGTSGKPKLVSHTLTSLIGAIQPGRDTPTDRAVWSTFYDIRRYGGLQVFFRGLLGGGSLVLPSPAEPVGEFLARAGRHGVTHISGTPSHWRRALMSPAAGSVAPKYVRLSGEIADQTILDDLKIFYGGASVAHAFATTEAGVAFAVNDGLAGFPATLVGRVGGDVEMKIEDGSLRIRSPRTASRYLAAEEQMLCGPDGFVDTGDIIEERGGRCHFMGRRGGIINVGGLKVHPEEVEAVINRHPRVQMSVVKARKNPFTGAVVIADVVVRPQFSETATTALLDEIIGACRGALSPHKVPAAIHIVSGLNLGSAGKVARTGA
jgi:acyl-CoA synthetase (AMP-forming)/AMP-acid ligase II